MPRRVCFSTSRRLGSASRAPTKNHYERLDVRHDATPIEIKKSFYRLSKAHHPDVNPNDPSASHTFSLISESYNILSDPPRRAAYDRDVLRLHQRSASSPQAGAAAYHSSTTPAGGRPASGLSKRRSTFRGPPPSFYRSGGWGAQADKRKKAHEESTGASSHDTGHRHRPNPAADGGEKANPWREREREQQYYQQHAGMGPGADPFGHHDDVPHFDRRATEQTQQREDQRRWARDRRAVGDDDVEFEPQMSLGAHFVIILGILATSFVVPMVYLRYVRNSKKKEAAP